MRVSFCVLKTTPLTLRVTHCTLATGFGRFGFSLAGTRADAVLPARNLGTTTTQNIRVMCRIYPLTQLLGMQWLCSMFYIQGRASLPWPAQQCILMHQRRTSGFVIEKALAKWIIKSCLDRVEQSISDRVDGVLEGRDTYELRVKIKIWTIVWGPQCMSKFMDCSQNLKIHEIHSVHSSLCEFFFN